MAQMLIRAFITAFIGFVVATAAGAQTTLTGRVVGVSDGDTITVLDANKTQHRVRIAGIDAPERGQSGGQRSKESLSAMVYDQPVRVESQKRDRFGRIIGKVWVASTDSSCRGKPDCPMMLDAGLAQITMGRAWWFRRYASEQSPEDRGSYESAEQQARAKKIGLWRDGAAVPPWEWRARRIVAPASAQPSGPDGRFWFRLPGVGRTVRPDQRTDAPHAASGRSCAIKIQYALVDRMRPVRLTRRWAPLLEVSVALEATPRGDTA